MKGLDYLICEFCPVYIAPQSSMMGNANIPCPREYTLIIHHLVTVEQVMVSFHYMYTYTRHVHFSFNSKLQALAVLIIPYRNVSVLCIYQELNPLTLKLQMYVLLMLPHGRVIDGGSTKKI